MRKKKDKREKDTREEGHRGEQNGGNGDAWLDLNHLSLLMKGVGSHAKE